jgi:hypothetical protein
MVCYAGVSSCRRADFGWLEFISYVLYKCEAVLPLNENILREDKNDRLSIVIELR